MEETLRVIIAGTETLTQSQIRKAAKPHLPKDLFLSGKTAGWGATTIELDLEARGIMNRTVTKPLKFFAT